MTVEACYKMLEGDFEEVMSRLKNEERVKKFALKFLNDESFKMLTECMEKHDIDEAFRAAHTIKGICQNLGFTKLYNSSVQITEALRVKDEEEARKYLPDVQGAYLQTTEALKMLQAEES